MPPALPERPLSQLALLYVTMAQSDDDELSPAELDAVIDTLHSRHFSLDRSDIQQVALDILEMHLDHKDLEYAVQEVIGALKEQLSSRQKQAVLSDLVHVAQSDGVVLDGEWELLHTLTAAWNVRLPVDTVPPTVRTTGLPEATASRPLHDLAFLYLVLAHGTDSEFSDDERLLLLRKLREWQPSLSESQVTHVLEQAVDRYGRGADAEAVRAAVEAVKTALPPEQRMAALHDLTQIANADGVFLDSEEDLINELMAAWM